MSSPEPVPSQATEALILSFAPSGQLGDGLAEWAAFTGAAPTADDWDGPVGPADRARLRQMLGALAAGSAASSLSIEARRRDGAWRRLDCRGRCLTGGQVVLFLQDVTDREAAEARARVREEHLSLLDRIAHETRSLSDAKAIMGTTARLLGEHLGAMRCAYADMDADNDGFTIRADWSRPGVPSSVGRYSLALFGQKAVHDLNRGRPLVVDDVDRDLGAEGGGRMFNAIGIKSIVCASLVKEERLVALMAVHRDQPHAWSPGEVELIGDVVDRCWAHIERVRDNEALRAQDRRKDEFLATLAHELRNPLAPMRYALALMRERPDPVTAASSRQVLERQVVQMTRLVDDLLDVSRISRGMITLQRDNVSVAEAVGLAAESSRPLVDAAGHTLVVRDVDPALTMHVDRARVVQMVCNLLTNAIKYTPHGGRIELRARRLDASVRIEVEDNGIGVDLAEQPLLFTMFTQLRNGLDRAQNGLGIGLSLVRQLAHMQDGKAGMSSSGVGRGSTFWIDLPLAPDVVAPANARPDAGTTRATVARRVLVVEDNVDGREALVALLQTLGFETVGAPDGPTALACGRSFSPEIVLLDLGLPGMHGLDVGTALRADPLTAGARLIALTGWGAERDREMTRSAGFDAHLTKPVDPDLLIELLSQGARGESGS